MSYTSIDNPELYFQCKTYVGNSTDDTAITLDGSENMEPNMIWFKDRTNANHGRIFDSVRGVTKNIYPSLGSSEGTTSSELKSFDSDGFTLGTGSDVNGNSANLVAWCWKAGTSFSNDASSTGIGTIDTTGSASDISGFSVVSYTGNSTSGASIKHGLSSAPKFVFGKARNTSGEDWFTGHASNGFDKYIKLNSTHAVQTFSGIFNDTAPSASVLTLGNNGASNASVYNYILYCFSEVKGFSRFSSYVGNGSENGTFVHTGFRVSWLMIRRTDSSNSWIIMDTKRNTFNPMGEELKAEVGDAGNDATRWDQLSNGFKLRNTGGAVNASGGTYIYLAFAESPFVNSKGIPTNAR
jgi:hypothetical protein